MTNWLWCNYIGDWFLKSMLMLGDSAADWDEDRGVTLVRREEVGPTSSSPGGPPSSLLPPLPATSTSLPGRYGSSLLASCVFCGGTQRQDKHLAVWTKLPWKEIILEVSRIINYNLFKLHCSGVASIWYSPRHSLIHELNLDFPVDFLKSFSLDFPKFLC